MLEGNHLLGSLAPHDQTRLESCLSKISLPKGHLLFEAGDLASHCYFPTGSAAASYFVLLQQGEAMETVLIGPEGCIGGFISRGRLPAFSRGAVVHGGDFYCISCNDLAELIGQSPELESTFRRYADCLMAQMFQTIACNGLHSIEQRTAKWLCAFADLTQQRVISMTQEQLAARMGSGRSYASRVMQRFKQDGLLRTHRGGFQVLDYERLRERACDCNELVREHFRKILYR